MFILFTLLTLSDEPQDIFMAWLNSCVQVKNTHSTTCFASMR